VADQQQIGRGTCDDLATNLVGCRTDDGAPETRGEESEEDDEQDNDDPYLRYDEPGMTSRRARARRLT